jgi:hypothetical protein
MLLLIKFTTVSDGNLQGDTLCMLRTGFNLPCSVKQIFGAVFVGKDLSR